MDKQYSITERRKKHEESPSYGSLMLFTTAGLIGGTMFAKSAPLLPQYLSERKEEREKKQSII